MKSIAKIVLCLAVLAIWVSCKKENNFSDIPKIENREFYKTSDTSAVWVIGFTDGDGDIGFGEGERVDETNFKTNIYLIESGVVDTSFSGTGFRIPKIEGVETKDGLEGEIRIDIQLNLFKIAPFPVDSIYYDGYLVDREGNKSNLIQTRVFTVN